MNSGDKIRGAHLPGDTAHLMLAVLFPLVAFALQWYFWGALQPYVWLLFYPAVFFSSWVGGKWGGFLAAAISTTLGWWFFLPPRYSFFLERPASAIAMGIFAVMGVLFSLTHERVRRANRQTLAALAAANAARDHLEERVGERTAELARTLDALRETEVKYRLTLDSMLEGCQIVGFDWRYLYLNESAEKHNRRPNAELLGRTVLECWPVFTETDVFAVEKRCMEERTTQKLEVEFTFPDGQRGWFRVIIQPATEGIVIFSEDITERKRAEAELKEQEAMLSLVLETIPVGVWIIDAKGTIIHGNQAGQKIWAGARYVGMERYDEYKGWWADTGRRIGAEEWAAARAITRGETSLDEEIDIECFDGARKTILHSGVPLRDTDQHITGAVIINQDITERRQAEQALRLREGELRRAQEIAKLGSWTYHMSGQFWWSDELYRICGVAPEKFTPCLESFFNLIHPDDRPAMQAWIDACSAGEKPGELVFRVVVPDGTVRFVSGRGELVHDAGGGIHLAGTGQDITERKQAEAALAESESAFRATFEQAAVGMARMAPDGRWLQVNQRLCDIVGYTCDELLALTLRDITHPEDVDADLGYKREMLAGEIETSSLEKRYICKDRSIVWVNLTVGLVRNAAGAPDYFISVVEDISKRKRAEKALRESEARFRRMFDQAPIGAAMVSLDYRFLMVNEALCRITGYSAEELTSRSFVDITHPDDIDADVAQARLLEAGQIDHYDMDKRYLRADGSEVWIHLNARRICDAEGKVLYYLPMMEDITQRKHVETALLEKQHQLEELNLNLEQRIADAVLESREKDRILMQQGRQAAMGEMIGNIAHQWRQPLNMLGLIVQELLMTYGREEFSKERLEASVKKAMGLISHMSKTIEDFRNYFKPDKEKILFDVNEAVAKALFLVEPSLKSLDIQIDVVEKDAAEINGFVNEYSQVLLNILLNCRDAFEGRSIDRQRVITITIFRENSRSVVTVADNAGGIPERIIDKIFDPYFTTKGPDKGTGIGLYMAKTIIEKNMDGRLTARNRAGGAEFRVEV